MQGQCLESKLYPIHLGSHHAKFQLNWLKNGWVMILSPDGSDRCGYEPIFRCGYEPPGRLENLRIKLTQTFIKDSVRSGLSLAITFVSRGSAHPLTPRCGKEKIKYAQNPPLVQHEFKISQNRKSKIWDEKWHPIPSPRVEGSMLSLTNISFSRISKEMVFAAAMCTFTGQVFRSGYVSGFSQRLCVGRVGWRIWE